MKGWDGKIEADAFIGYQPHLYRGNPPAARGSRRYNCSVCGDYIWFDRGSQKRIAATANPRMVCFACVELEDEMIPFTHADEDLVAEYGVEAPMLIRNRDAMDDDFLRNMVRYARVLKALKQKPVNPCISTPPKRTV